jgi:Protein of unknown function (DUF3995)
LIAISAALIATLTALGLLHLYWGLGGCWPGKDKDDLAARMVGVRAGKGGSRKGPGLAASAAVALALFAATAIVLLRRWPIATGAPAFVIHGGYAALILVFGLRGLAPYFTPIFNYARGTPFYELNRRYYAPLCLLIAAALIADAPPGAAHAFGE